MAKKSVKQDENSSLARVKSAMESLGLDESNLEILVMGGNIIIKPKNNDKTSKKRKKDLEESAKRIMDKYESVFKKLAKT